MTSPGDVTSHGGVTSHRAHTAHPPEAVAAVEAAFRAMARAFRARQMYLANNPTRALALVGAREQFERIFAHVDAITIKVGDATLSLDDTVVLDDSQRGTDGLPWLMYRDGLRVLSFASGFGGDGIEALLDLLHRARSASPDEDDLVTLLWVADLPHFRYLHVEGNATAPPAPHDGIPGDTMLPHHALAAPAVETDAVGEGPPPGVIRLEDFDETLYFLDASELAYLQREVQRQYTDDTRLAALMSLFEILEMPLDEPTWQETMGIVSQLLLEFLAAGALDLGATVLREAARQKATHPSPAIRDLLAALPLTLSAPAVMQQLLHAVESLPATAAPGADDAVRAAIELLFTQLQPAALATIASWLGTVPPSPQRDAVEAATVRLAAAHTAALARLLDAADDDVVSGALRLAVALASPATVPSLSRVLLSTETARRRDAAAALRAIGTGGALRALEPLVHDPDRDVRIQVLRAFAHHRHAPALGALRDALTRRDIRSADRSEKLALLETFALLGQDDAVGDLDALLNARGLLGPRAPSDLRAAAARALGIIGTTRAMAALEQAEGARDLVVRTAVARALRGVA